MFYSVFKMNKKSLEDQKKDLQELQRLYTEYKSTQKNEAYLQSILATVDALWMEIVNRNDELVKKPHKNQPYFDDKVYDDAEIMYNEFHGDIEQQLSAYIDGSNVTVGAPSRKSTLLQVQYEELLLLVENAESLENQAASSGYIKAHVDMLKTAWNEFRSQYLQDRANGQRILFSYAQIQDRYITIIGKLTDSSINDTKNEIKLPQIKLPQFNGDIAQWKTYIGLFDRMVHNNKNIDNGIKMEYLKTTIIGNAAKLINHISPTSENYFTCYDILKQRFENKREILGKYLESKYA